MLSEKNAGGMAEVMNVEAVVEPDSPSFHLCCPVRNTPGVPTIGVRGINGGALVLPALHGGGDETKQIMLILSAADNYGGPGEYSLMAAKTGLMVSLMDGMGGTLVDPSAADTPVFGGAVKPDAPPGTKIIVEGIQVMTNAGDCDGDMIMGPWTLDHLTSLVPSAVSGTKDFAGLMNEDMDPMMNASPGWIKFKHAGLKCEMDFGDGDVATGNPGEDADGVPTVRQADLRSGYADHRGGETRLAPSLSWEASC